MAKVVIRCRKSGTEYAMPVRDFNRTRQEVADRCGLNFGIQYALYLYSSTIKVSEQEKQEYADIFCKEIKEEVTEENAPVISFCLQNMKYGRIHSEVCRTLLHWFSVLPFHSVLEECVRLKSDCEWKIS